MCFLEKMEVYDVMETSQWHLYQTERKSIIFRSVDLQMILMWHRPLNNIITQNFFCLLTKRYLWKYTNFKLPRNVWNLWTELWIAWHWFLNLSFNAIFSDMLTLLLKLQYWFLAIRGHGNDFHCESFARWSCSNCYSNCLVPVPTFSKAFSVNALRWRIRSE